MGPYEIVAPLGAGGMGEVYRARDTKLGRDVAIKVLPAAVAQDPERLARFKREAQVLASLNHPNIAAIYGLDEAASTLFLVMELVEGEDLAERLKRGAIPLDEALGIAKQIAEALEEAHDKGIVHRDLKPANIKLASSGQAKVLDFGLAKAYASDASASESYDLANSPTMTHAATMAGVILGTAAYMSPEQARGKAVDKRADIWAFGVVLYEMLTGKNLFDGETVSDTLAAVLTREIDAKALPAAAPAALRRLLRVCLERNPKNRLHDIADARIAIDEIQRGAHDEAQPAAGVAPPVRTGGGLVLAGVAAAALAAGIAAGWLLRTTGPKDAAIGADARWALAIPDGMTLSTDEFPQVDLSADGRLQVAVVVDAAQTRRVLLRESDQLKPRILQDTDGADGPFFSPDGQWVGFFRERSLLKISVAGGPPVELAANITASATRGGSWGPDGFIYLAPRVGAGLSRIAEGGGPIREFTTLDLERDERTHRWPQALPEGGAVLFTCDTASSTEFYDDARIEAVRVATGERRVLVEGASMARYAGGGRLVFARGGSLFSIAFDPRTLTVSGAPEVVAQGIATDVGSGAAQFALSASGAALWVPGGLGARYQFVWADRSGRDTPVGIPPAPYNEGELSPDGKRVALVGGTGGAADLWIADLERGGQTRLTVGQSVGNPVWSPDGSRIAYIIRPDGRQVRDWQIAWKLADGSRAAEVLLDSKTALGPSGFTPDGRKLLYSAGSSADGATDLYALPVTGARTPELLIGDAFIKRDAVVSPDGRWLAYTSTEGGQFSVFVRPFPSGEGRWQISIPPGVEPRFSRDQREIFYRSGSNLYRVAIDSRNGFSAGRPELLLDRVSSSVSVHTYAPTPDGTRFFTARSPEGRGAARTLDLDLGFARRIGAGSRP